MAAEISKTDSSSSSLSLHGRVAIVTGASRGIGRAIATHLHSLGAKVVINYASNSTQADILASQLNSSSPNSAITVQADVSDQDQVKLLFDKTEQEFGPQIHILVNCACVLDPKYPTLANTAIEDWDRIFNINTRGSFLSAREAANRLIRGGGGRIVLITTSVIGANLPGYGAYTASKAAVETMTRILAKELKGTGITANCVAPGPVATELFSEENTDEMIKRLVDACPLGRVGETKDVSPLVEHLVSDAGEWINGQIVRANEYYFQEMGQSSQSVKWITWHPMRENSIIINVDGSCPGNPGNAGFGGLLRKASGEWICGFAGFIGLSNRFHAELMALFHGLRVTWSLGYRRVICYSDSQDALAFISQRPFPSTDKYAPLVLSIQDLLTKDWTVRMVHTLREGNQCADFLAKLGTSQEDSFVTFTRPPSGLFSLLLADAMRVAFPRS